MPQFNFLNVNKSINFEIEILGDVNNLTIEQKKIPALSNQESLTEKIKKQSKKFLQDQPTIDTLFNSVKQTLKYLNSIDYLPPSLPDNIDITFINTYKLNFLNSKEDKDLEKETGGSAVRLSTKTPLILLSSSILNKKQNKNSFYNFCYSAFKDVKTEDNKNLSQFQVQQMIIEMSFLHELGHIFSILNHTDKTYFLREIPEPILNSIKRNYEESFAESFCAFVLNKKYPNQKFLDWMQVSRAQASNKIDTGLKLDYYDISHVYTLVKNNNSINVEQTLNHIEHCAFENLKHVLNKKIILEPQFLKELETELNSSAPLAVNDIITKVKHDFSTSPVVNTSTSGLKTKIFSFRDIEVKALHKKVLN